MSVSSFPFWIALLGWICESCIHCSIINQVSLLKLNHDFLIGSQSWYKTTQVHRGILLTLKLKSNGKIPSFSFVFLALTLFLPFFTLLLFFIFVGSISPALSVFFLFSPALFLSYRSPSLARARSLSLFLSVPSGVYGDVQRVKILYNKKDSALIQLSDGNQAQLGKFEII